jgi:hypothetical protein
MRNRLRTFVWRLGSGRVPKPLRGVKRNIDAWLLNVAQTNIATRFGIFATLRGIQRRRIEHTRQDENLDPQPSGVSLEPYALRLFEVFFVERFDDLEKGLRDLFRDATRRFSTSGFLDDFRATGLSIDRTSSTLIGRVYPPHARVLPVNPIARINLPDEIEYLEVHVHKGYPSIYVVVIDSVFSEIGRKRWADREAEDILVDTELAGVVPGITTGNSYRPLWLTKQRRFVEYTDHLRKSIERVLSPYIAGHWFLGHVGSKNDCSLPAIQIFGLSGAPRTDGEFRSWIEQNSLWWDGHAVDPLHTYADENYMVSLRRRTEFSNSAMSYIIARTENVSAVAHRIYEDLPLDEMVLSQSEGFIEGISTVVIIDALLQIIHDEVERVRPWVFRDLSRRKMLRRLIATSLQVQAIALHFDRFQLEWSNSHKWLKAALRSLGGFSIRFRKFAANMPADVDNDFSYRFNLLKQQIRYLEDALGRYLQIKVAASNSWFQWGVLIVGALSLLAGIGSLIAAAIQLKH